MRREKERERKRPLRARSLVYEKVHPGFWNACILRRQMSTPETLHTTRGPSVGFNVTPRWALPSLGPHTQRVSTPESPVSTTFVTWVTSFIRKHPLLRPYSRPVLRVLWWSWGGERFLMSEVPL